MQQQISAPVEETYFEIYTFHIHCDATTHLIANGWQYSFVVVQPQLTVHCRQLIFEGSMQDSEANIHHLQVFTTRGGRQEFRPRSDVIDDGVLEPRYPGNGMEWYHPCS